MQLMTHGNLPWRLGLRRGVRLLARERRWRSSFALLTLGALAFFLALLFMQRLEHMRAAFPSQLPIRLEVEFGARDQDIQEFYAAAHALPSIATIRYTKGGAFFMTLHSFEDALAFQQFVELPRWRAVIASSFLDSLQNQKQHLEYLLHVTGAARTFGRLLVFLCIALLILTTFHLTKQARARQHDEARLMSLLGAPPLAAALPFVTQTTILLTGAVAAAGLFTFFGMILLRL